MTEVDCEEFWTKRSDSLKKYQENGVNKKPKNRTRKNVNSTKKNDYHKNHKDLRKGSYPVLPSSPISNINSKVTRWTAKNSGSKYYSQNSYLDNHSLSSASSITPNRPPTFDWTRRQPTKKPANQRPPSSTVTSELTVTSAPSSSASSKQYILRNLNQRNHFHALQSEVIDLLDEILEDELIPDILIEAFKEIEVEQKKHKKKMEPLVRSTAEQILSESLDEAIHDIVLTTVLQNTKSLLRAQIVSKQIIDAALLSMLPEIIEDSVSSVVHDQMKQKWIREIGDDIITSFIRDTVMGLEEEMQQELMLESLLQDLVVDGVVEELVKEIGSSQLEYYRHKVSRLTLLQIGRLSVDRPLAGIMMDTLASTGSRYKASGASSVLGHGPVQHLLFDRIVFNILLQQINDIQENIADTVENKPIRDWHKQLNSKMASQVLLDNLKKYSNDDLCDLDESEVDDSQTMRYITDVDSLIYQST